MKKDALGNILTIGNFVLICQATQDSDFDIGYIQKINKKCITVGYDRSGSESTYSRIYPHQTVLLENIKKNLLKIYKRKINLNLIKD